MSQDNYWFTHLFHYFMRKISVPSDYKNQVKAVKEMQKDDVSGLVDVLTDFAVETASVNFSIETDNPELTKKLNKWLKRLNLGYKDIPTGVNALAVEYFKERWKSSSFPILKMPSWENKDGLLLPTKMFFVDGESVKAVKKDSAIEGVTLNSYDYYLGHNEDGEKLNKNVIITKPFARWFDKYPTPYLIKRGIYHNWRLIQSLKNMQGEIVEQVIPYMLTIKKGSERLMIEKDIGYSNDELQSVIDDFRNLINEYKDLNHGTINTPMRATNFDEEFKQLIPDLETIFTKKIFEQTERNILSGLGFIDVEEAVSSSRQESILNPKAFIKEIEAGVKDFRQVLTEIVLNVLDKNEESHRKYVNVDIEVVNSPITGFMSDKFKNQIKQLYTKGLVSKKTTVELIGEIDYDTELKRRDFETRQGHDLSMYPPVERNQEGVGIDIPGETTDNTANPEKKEVQEELPDDKVDPVEKQEYYVGNVEIEGAPYSDIKSLPKSVKENLNIDLQRVFMNVFNKAYQTYQNEQMAFQTAWSVIKKIARKDKKGVWVRKKKREEGKLKPVELTQSMLNDILDKVEKQVIDEALAIKNLEMSDKKKELFQKILKQKQD